MTKRRIYVASSWRNAYQQKVVTILRGLGHDVYDFRHPAAGNDGFHWSEIDPEWQTWGTLQYRSALSHPVADAGFAADFSAMEWADTCVLVLPCGRSAHAEAGWMAGRGKDVYVLVVENFTEPELMYRLFDGIIAGMEELEDCFSAFGRAKVG